MSEKMRSYWYQRPSETHPLSLTPGVSLAASCGFLKWPQLSKRLKWLFQVFTLLILQMESVLDLEGFIDCKDEGIRTDPDRQVQSIFKRLSGTLGLGQGLESARRAPKHCRFSSVSP